MELRDLIVTPLFLIIIGFGGIIIRPWFTDAITKKYFLPALWCKIVGALALGFLYQFYYDGGDTFNYHTFGSRVVWEALLESPLDGLQLLFSRGGKHGELYGYTSRIVFFTDPGSYFVVRIAGFIDLLTFSTYTATAIVFSLFSFFGVWYLFKTFYEYKPNLHRSIAIAVLFIPSLIFWGSGLLKDTITLGAIGFLTYTIKKIFIDKNVRVLYVIVLLLSAYLAFEIKRYIILCFFPAALIWVYVTNLSKISSFAIRLVLFPVMIVTALGSAYLASVWIGKNDARYSLDKIAVTAKITAYDIGFYTGKDAGSGYNLGELDGTFTGMLRLAPQAINASLFRPYLWEVRNPLMLLSAIESFVFFLFTLFVIARLRLKIFHTLSDPYIIFCFTFSLTFAFAVGVATFNFGTLTRYKIPMLPFYMLALILLNDYWNKEVKVARLDSTEK
jgi:hypothetical protein